VTVVIEKTSFGTPSPPQPSTKKKERAHPFRGVGGLGGGAGNQKHLIPVQGVPETKKVTKKVRQRQRGADTYVRTVSRWDASKTGQRFNTSPGGGGTTGITDRT